MKSTKIVLGAVILILVMSVVYLLATRQPTSSDVKVESQTAKPDPMKAQTPPAPTDQQKAEIKAGSDAHNPSELTFHITGGSFYFTPNEIKVKQGDKVKIVFTNVLGTHNLILDDLGISTKTIKDGESDTIEFTASKKGVFEFYCGVGNGYHRMMGQIGVLIVQ